MIILSQNVYNIMKKLLFNKVNRKSNDTGWVMVDENDIEFNRVGDGSFPEGDNLYKNICERAITHYTMASMYAVNELLSHQPKQILIFCDLADDKPLSENSSLNIQIMKNLTKGMHIEFESGNKYEIIKVYDGNICDIKSLQPQFEWMPDFYPVYYSIQLKEFKIL